MSASPDQTPTQNIQSRTTTAIDDVDKPSDTMLLREDTQGPIKDQSEEENNADVSIVPSDKLLNIKAFLESIGDRPVFTQKLVTLNDCYGDQITIPTAELITQGKFPQLLYNSYHVLADDEPYNILRLCPPSMHEIVRGFGDDVEEMIEHSKYPLYIHFTEVKETHDYDLDDMLQKYWHRNGALGEKLRTQARRRRFHRAGSYSLIRRVRKPPEDPITITAQDPAYTENDDTVLSLFPIPIRIVSDPEGFLAINESSLVMSCYPTVPVKQMVADLAADSVSGKGPAALFWNDSSWDEKHGDTDTVTYRWTEVVYFANPGSRRLVNMLDGYEKVMGGAEAFANRFNTEQQEDGHEKDVSELAQTTTGLSAQYESADGILQATDAIGHEQDDTASVENRVELNNNLEGLEEGEEHEEDEKDEDITKGVLGFKWLKDMEIWACRKVATSY